MASFETRNILRGNRENGPRRLNEETLSGLEAIIRDNMEPLDPEDIGPNIGISDEEISADTEYVSTTNEKISRSNDLAQAIKEKRLELEGLESRDVAKYYERLGHAFEGFLYSNISESRIFNDVILHKTAEFDDLKNGVDFVAEYKDPDNPKSYIALAMDASFSMSPALIGKKIDRSLKDLSEKRLSKVKYFQFEEDAPEAKIGMPRVVVGTDEDRVRSLLQRWHTKETIGSTVIFEDDPVWTLMALQINDQLKMFIDEASSHNQNELADICKKYQRALEASLRLNKDLVDKHKVLLGQDGTSIAISGYCSKAASERVTSRKGHSEAEQERKDEEMYRASLRA